MSRSSNSTLSRSVRLYYIFIFRPYIQGLLNLILRFSVGDKMIHRISADEIKVSSNAGPDCAEAACFVVSVSEHFLLTPLFVSFLEITDRI